MNVLATDQLHHPFDTATHSRRTILAGAACGILGTIAEIPGVASASDERIPQATPAASQLGAVQNFLEAQVAAGNAPGAAWLVSHRGEVEVGATGFVDLDSGELVRRDTIFRIASLTKPVIGVAAMTLVDQGEIALDDSVEPWLPELADRPVLRTLASPLDDTVPAERPITLRDLLSQRMGLGFFLYPPGTYPIQVAFNEAELNQLETGDWALPFSSSDDFMAALGSLPLAHQPGEVFRYHTPLDVAGVLIERITGGSLGDYLHEHVFRPLGMIDTGFWVAEEKLHRLATLYRRNPRTGDLEVADPAAGGAWSAPRAFESGAVGLASTLDDYLAFGRAMLNRGQFDGGRLLTDASFTEMTRDQLTRDQKAMDTFFPGWWQYYGYGLGVGIVTADQFTPGTGSIGWLGGSSTVWFSDPANDLVGILMMQVQDLPWFGAVYPVFWGHVYEALQS